MTLTPSDLRAAAQGWLADDPDPVTKAELTALLGGTDDAALLDQFGMTLEFGTAGLRGLLGAGPNRMNRRMVIRATAGLLAWLRSQVPDAAERGVCIGFDGRRMSREFAEDVARVVVGAGFRAYAFPEVVATPVLAFAVLDTKAAAGVMVTASHNPPAYNGYKVYWGNGAQIIPPHDKGIAAEIEKITKLDQVPQAAGALASAKNFTALGEDVVDRYLAGVAKLTIHNEAPRDLTIAYTALHGVGNRFAKKALANAGFTRVHSVAAQAEPDGAFPTVAFPNPEEQGAMDLVVALAKETKAELVIANDPDADRLAVAVRDPAGEYVMLTGNEIGCLLAHYLLDQGPKGKNRLVISTIVSSPMLGAIAAAHGARWEQTLTGFKWIANRALELSQTEDQQFVFGYEEALGYCVGNLVRDKDGVGAATVFADFAAWCHSRGKTVLDERTEIWRRYGLFMSRQVSLVLPGAEGSRDIAAIMSGVRAAAPKKIGAFAVTAVDDLGLGIRRVPGQADATIPGERSDVLILSLAEGHRVMLRPSGTEPKIKFYFDVRVTMAAGETAEAAVTSGNRLLEELTTDFRSQVGR